MGNRLDRTIGLQGRTPLTEPLTVAIAGGGFAGRLALDALVASDRFTRIAVADTSPGTRSALQADFPQLEMFSDHVAMFNAVSPDVVCVSTPPATHEPVAMAALGLPLKGIVVEKPLAHNAASGRSLLNAIMARDVPLVVPHGMAVQATALEVIERVHGGDIGTVDLIEIRTSGWDIINAGIHWLHFCVQLLAPDRVDHVMALCESSTKTFRDGLQVETTAVTYVETVAGSRIVMISGDDVTMPAATQFARFRVIGSRGQIEFSGFAEGYRIQNAEHPATELIEPVPRPGSGHRLMLERLAHEIAEGRADYTLANGSLAALEISEAAYVSNRHRCKVQFPFEEFVPPSDVDWDPGRLYDGEGGGRDGRSL